MTTKTIIATIVTISLYFTLGSCSAAQTKSDSPFEYREIYMLGTMGEQAKEKGLNSVDLDWGLWGHNIADILPDKPAVNIYARVGNRTFDKQYCFSSNHLFQYIEEYINDNFGDNDTIRFAIIPNDNDIVCLDDKCRHAGNTEDDASPAIYNLLRRLCERFPNHIFFTADYQSVKNLPTTPLPKNAGVLVSAINFPRTVSSTAEETEFLQRIADWKKMVDRVYVWDYICNFDDYFTPVPIFSIMQHRLQKYRDAGVKGVFLNGSGPDYSSFSRATSAILTDLLNNPDVDWKATLKQYCDERYPVAGEHIYNFMVAQDDYFQQKGQPLPMYDGVQKALEVYLPESQFVEFYNQLVSARDLAEGDEMERLNKILNTLSMTMLEIKRINGDLTGYQDPLRRFTRLLDNDIDAYNESYWSVSDYISDYKFIVDHNAEVNGKNLLKGVKLKSLSPLDPDYNDISIITNGLLGIPSNYHSGNLIWSGSPSLNIEVPYTPGMSMVRIAFVDNAGYKIGLPSQVTASYEGQVFASVVPKRLKQHGGHSFVELNVPSHVAGPIVVKIYRDPDVKTIAVEEVEGL